MTLITSRKAIDFTDSVEITPADLKVWENRLDVLTNTRGTIPYIATEDAFDPGYMTEEEFTGVPETKIGVVPITQELLQLAQNLSFKELDIALTKKIYKDPVRLAEALARLEAAHVTEDYEGAPPATCTVSEAINVLTQLQYHAGEDAPLTVDGKSLDVCDFCAHIKDPT